MVSRFRGYWSVSVRETANSQSNDAQSNAAFEETVMGMNSGKWVGNAPAGTFCSGSAELLTTSVSSEPHCCAASSPILNLNTLSFSASQAASPCLCVVFSNNTVLLNKTTTPRSEDSATVLTSRRILEALSSSRQRRTCQPREPVSTTKTTQTLANSIDISHVVPTRCAQYR